MASTTYMLGEYNPREWDHLGTADNSEMTIEEVERILGCEVEGE